ncbi:MAG: HD family phosphohydrolase [Gemmatimonadota bacterium]
MRRLRRLRAAVRDFLRAMNREPGTGWRDRIAHHGTRVLVVLAIAASLPVLFPVEPLPDVVTLEEGTVAPEDVIATLPVAVPKAADRLAAERREAEKGVAPIFVLDPTARDSAVNQLDAFFRALDEAAADTVGQDTARMRSVLASYGIRPTAVQEAYLASGRDRAALRRGLERAYRSILPRGVAAILDLPGQTVGHVVIRGEVRDRLVRADSITTVARFVQTAVELAPGGDAEVIHLFQTLLVRFVTPSLRPDAEATAAARMQARSAVDTIAFTVLPGERIVSAHERVGRAEIEKLRAYRAALVRSGQIGSGGLLRNAGSVLYGVLLLGILGAVLFLFRPGVYRDAPAFFIVMLLVALVLAASALVARADANPTLIPIAFLAILLGALWDGLVALVAVMVVAALVGGQVPFTGISVPFLVTAGGAAAAIGIRGVRRRAQSLVIIGAVAGAYVAAGAALVLMRSLPVGEFLSMAGWGAVSATLSTVLAIGAAVPALERATGITTDQSLLELSDLNAPLLRDLSLKAPGTYAHSINVANLAEAACTEIGANPLLARAGAYYHDIGKMQQPQYFVENQPKGRNPHDRLRPARSAAIIREHVREGLRLAAEHRLPRVIRDFICEHHGTMAISFFLERAREEDPEAEIDPNDFAYPGPKPRSRETAVVMLADGVESSSRVLQDPTPDRIRALIDQIVEGRVREGQLDRCPLTMHELDRVKSQFARVLVGMYHRRIEYPSGVRPSEAPASVPLPGPPGGGSAREAG